MTNGNKVDVSCLYEIISVKTKKRFDLKTNRIVKNGKDGVIICTGPTVVIAYNISQMLLKKYKFDLGVFNVHTIKPLEKKTIINIAKKTKKVFIIEEHQMNGGLRDIISNVIVSNKIHLKKFLAFGINDQFCSYNGTYEGIKKKYILSENQISKKILKNLKK